jgi:sodium pump decarboxylase gamma subunit
MMINTALAMSFGERTAYAGKVFLIGMGTIFAALIVLWLVLALFRKFVAYYNGEDLLNEQTAPKPTPVITPAPKAVQTATGDDALIAVITAAVAAALAEENGGAVPGFRVVSFQKISTVSNRK